MILLDSVTKRYPGDADPALDNVSLHIEPNEFVFLVGKSGAGKSTLIKMLTKEEVPDSGKIIIGGIDLDYVKKRHIPGYRRRLGVVFQDFKLLPRRTVYENVAFALEIIGMSGKEIRKTVPKVLELVDLLDQAKKFPDQLSGGQRQRVSIARSVARQPKILIADEPTGQLDKLTTKEMIDLLRKINDFGTTILVTTHNENIVNDLQKRVITLKDGRIVNDQKNHGIYKLDDKAWTSPYLLDKQNKIRKIPYYADDPDSMNLARLYVRTNNPTFTKPIFEYDINTQELFCNRYSEMPILLSRALILFEPKQLISKEFCTNYPSVPFKNVPKEGIKELKRIFSDKTVLIK